MTDNAPKKKRAPRRRPKGLGSVFSNNGRWWIGYEDEHGNRVRIPGGLDGKGAVTKTEAEEKLKSIGPEAPEYTEIRRRQERATARLDAAARRAGDFSLVMTAEAAGAYKPDPRPYRAALSALGLDGTRVLFVAGSAHDVGGAARVGMDVYWANRHGAAMPDDATPLVHAADLSGLAALVSG